MPWRNLEKPLEYWLVIAGMALYVTMRNESLPFTQRTLKTLASALLSLGLSASVAPWLNGSEVFAAVFIMAVGLILLDVLVALVQDRDFIKDLVRRRLGGGGA